MRTKHKRVSAKWQKQSSTKLTQSHESERESEKNIEGTKKTTRITSIKRRKRLLIQNLNQLIIHSKNMTQKIVT